MILLEKVRKIPWFLHRTIMGFLNRGCGLVTIRHLEFWIIRKWLRKTKPRILLELAMGFGTFTGKLVRIAPMYLGLDIRGEESLFCRKRYGPKFVMANAEVLPLEDNSVDAIVSNSAFQHFDYPEKAFGEIERVLTSGGRAYLTFDSLSYVNLPESVRNRHRDHYMVKNYFTHDKVEGMVMNLGLEILEYRYYLNSFPSYWLHRLWLRAGFNRWPKWLFPLSFPFCLLSDYLFGDTSTGGGLAVVLEKR